jgi:hypothetical protein
MTIAALLGATMLALSGGSECTMNPPPLAIETFRASEEVKAYVADSSKSASVLLKDGSYIRVINMACVDSGAIAKAWIPNPPPESDLAAWRKLFAKVAGIAFGSYAQPFKVWIPKANFKKDDNFILSASTNQSVELEIIVKSLDESMGDIVTISYTYN